MAYCRRLALRLPSGDAHVVTERRDVVVHLRRGIGNQVAALREGVDRLAVQLADAEPPTAIEKGTVVAGDSVDQARNLVDVLAGEPRLALVLLLHLEGLKADHVFVVGDRKPRLRIRMDDSGTPELVGEVREGVARFTGLVGNALDRDTSWPLRE